MTSNVEKPVPDSYERRYLANPPLLQETIQGLHKN